MSESDARPRFPTQCDNCGAEIGDVGFANVIFFDDGYWGLAPSAVRWASMSPTRRVRSIGRCNRS